MSLLIDDREDPAIRRALVGQGVEVLPTRLDFGDLAFEGYGPNGPLMVGFERKHLPDLVHGMTDKRVLNQLSGMLRLYDALYLVLEDNYRPDNHGGIEYWRAGKWTPLYTSVGADHHSHQGVNFRQLDAFLTSLERLYGAVTLRSGSIRETAYIYAARYHWFQKPWADHRSADQIYAPGIPDMGRKASFMTRPPTLLEKVATQLPGIGLRAWDIGAHFESVTDMVNATQTEWMQIPGIGKETSKRIVESLRRST